jgi:citronellol/citronellal dehydrogenase
MTEGALALLPNGLDDSQIERLEEMVEATMTLCRCPPEITGQVTVSLDLLSRFEIPIDRWMDPNQ